MSETEESFTRGPWLALQVGSEEPGAWFVYDGRGRRFMYLDGDGNEDEVSARDAVLVAAAPRLHAALLSTLGFLVDGPQTDENQAKVVKEIREALGRCVPRDPDD